MKCPVCLNEEFEQINVLKPRLIKEWNLTQYEADYINKQQGFQCSKCKNNLRTMTLAQSIMDHYSFSGCFKQFIYSKCAHNLRLLEINAAGGLHNLLKYFRRYTFASYPDVDIQRLPYSDEFFDIVVHSDTLEHVENTSLGLSECYRVLRDGGTLFYTIPIIYSRLTRRRDFLSNSYHGTQDEQQGEDYKVFTEYGADFWVEIINAKFKNISLVTLGDLSSVAIFARKIVDRTYEIKDLQSIFFAISAVTTRIKKAIEKLINEIYWRKVCS